MGKSVPKHTSFFLLKIILIIILKIIGTLACFPNGELAVLLLLLLLISRDCCNR